MKHTALKRCIGATLFGALFAATAGAAPSGPQLDPCLDYFQVGDSGCRPARQAQPSPTATVAPVAASPTALAPRAPTLDDKIDDFLDNHGKPPREFVAFYLDPTPQNAMKWISKYNELLDRNTQIAVAWTQAETLYARALNQGVSASALVSSTLPPVPDFGVPIPGFSDNPDFVGSSMPGVTYAPLGGAPGMVTPTNPNTTSVIRGMLSNAAGLNGAAMPGAEQPFSAIRPLEADGRLGTPLIVVSRTTPNAPVTVAEPDLNLTYYFSAVCPYCQRFAPQLNEALAAVPNARISCVDVTSLVSSKPATPEYITQSVPRCQWRLPNEGEISQKQIRQTPTLLVQWGAAEPQRINGYVDAARLKSAFSGNGMLGR